LQVKQRLVITPGQQITFGVQSGTILEVDDGKPAPLDFGPIPGDVASFLGERGWGSDNDMTHWYRDQLSGFYYSWEQAMAIEFYKFITLGGR
jgi:hypothetical protein